MRLPVEGDYGLGIFLPDHEKARVTRRDVVVAVRHRMIERIVEEPPPRRDGESRPGHGDFHESVPAAVVDPVPVRGPGRRRAATIGDEYGRPRAVERPRVDFVTPRRPRNVGQPTSVRR